MLLSLLDGHPETIAFTNETHFFTQFLPKFNHRNEEENAILAQEILLGHWNEDNPYYQKFLNHFSCDQVHISFQNILEETAKESIDYLSSAILGYGEAANILTDQTKYWVEKTPGNEFFGKFIRHKWPTAKCIHIVRDPRDVYSSYKNRAIRRGRAIPLPDSVIFSWIKSIEAYQKNLLSFSADKYLLVRFEDLVGNLEHQLNTIIEFLGISDNSCLREPTKGNQVAWAGNSIDTNYAKVSKTPIARWKENLTLDELIAIEHLSRSWMESLGYQPHSNVDDISRPKRIYLAGKMLIRKIRWNSRYTKTQ